MAEPYQVVVFQNPENPLQVCIMYPTGVMPLEELIPLRINTELPYKIMSPVDLPSIDEAYYNAWHLVPSVENLGSYEIEVHLERAKEIHRTILREERKPKLEALDIAFMLALERGDTAKQQEVVAQKQVLRDITKHPFIEAATTTAELRVLTLDVLLGMSS